MESLSFLPSMVGRYTVNLSRTPVYGRAAAGSIPCRSFIAAVAGDAMKARSCRAAAGSAQATEIPPEKVVML
jgi:hypothetical protein